MVQPHAPRLHITVMPLVSLWRACGKEDHLPPTRTRPRRALLGATASEITGRQRTVRLPAQGMRLDLGGLGKGYIVDQVVKLYRRHGVPARW